MRLLKTERHVPVFVNRQEEFFRAFDFLQKRGFNANYASENGMLKKQEFTCEDFVITIYTDALWEYIDIKIVKGDRTLLLTDGGSTVIFDNDGDESSFVARFNEIHNEPHKDKLLSLSQMRALIKLYSDIINRIIDKELERRASL